MEKQGDELENREEDEDGLENREDEEDVGGRPDDARRPAGTCAARLFEVEDAEEEQEEVEDEGLAFCVDIWGDRGKSNKSNNSWWWLLVSRLWFCCSRRGCWVSAARWALGAA